jgi:hypothetical protein
MYYLFLIFIILVAIFIFVSIMIYKEKENQSNIKEGLTNNDNTTIILIGDSILNNSNYILDESKSVPGLIKAEHSDTYVFAKDGAVITDCVSQIEEIPAKNNTSKTNIFVSAGGNNILNSQHKISKEMIDTFFQQYSTLIHSLKTKLPNTQIYLLNLYYPLDSRFKNMYPYIEQWNTLVYEFAETNDLEIIQTNKLIINNEDFTNTVEPSEIGGKKLANVILAS